MLINKLYVSVFESIKTRLLKRIDRTQELIERTYEAEEAAEELNTKVKRNADELAESMKESADKMLDEQMQRLDSRRAGHNLELANLLNTLG